MCIVLSILAIKWNWETLMMGRQSSILDQCLHLQQFVYDPVQLLLLTWTLCVGAPLLPCLSCIAFGPPSSLCTSLGCLILDSLLSSPHSIAHTMPSVNYPWRSWGTSSRIQHWLIGTNDFHFQLEFQSRTLENWTIVSDPPVLAILFYLLELRIISDGTHRQGS